MKTKVEYWVTLVGVLIGAITYWRTPYDEMNLLETQIWLIVGSGALIGSLFSTIYFNQ